MITHTPEHWDRDAIYWLLRFASKNDGPWNDTADEGAVMPDESDADLIAAVPELLAQRDLLLAVVQAIAGDGIQRVSTELHQQALAAIRAVSG
jgi:hypothetical protein